MLLSNKLNKMDRQENHINLFSNSSWYYETLSGKTSLKSFWCEPWLRKDYVSKNKVVIQKKNKSSKMFAGKFQVMSWKFWTIGWEIRLSQIKIQGHLSTDKLGPNKKFLDIQIKLKWTHIKQTELNFVQLTDTFTFKTSKWNM